MLVICERAVGEAQCAAAVIELHVGDVKEGDGGGHGG
jgi:hypothetical protein